jgi:hypothetical protein
MTEHRGVKFEGGTVDMDNSTFVDCTFSGTRLVFQAAGPVAFDRCEFDNVTVRFEGSAALTLSFLANLAAGSPGLHQTVERIVTDVLDNALRFVPLSELDPPRDGDIGPER